jgi:hypothetical protein
MLAAICDRRGIAVGVKLPAAGVHPVQCWRGELGTELAQAWRLADDVLHSPELQGQLRSYKFTFPDGVPLLEQQESFARLLRRATDADPDRRFGSAADMAEQLTGVLREVLAVADGTPRPAFSTVFSPELQAIGTGDDTG